jgi:actin-like ATPase involved in cell morphogenesis
MSRYGLGIDVGAGTVTAAVCPIDDAEPGATGRALIRDRGRCRSSDIPLRVALPRVGDPTPIYGGPMPPTGAEVVAAAVAGVQAEATDLRDGAPDWTVVTVPPSWGEHRRAALSAALTEAVGEHCTLASSAVAAARRHRTDAPAGTVAVYDLGASTVDTAVVRTAADGTLEHAAVPREASRWGGRDIDDAVLEHVRLAVGLPEVPDRRGARHRQIGLRDACTSAKERLSTQLAARVDVDVPGAVGTVRLVRADLDELIAGAVSESVAALRSAVTDAGLEPEDLDGIVLAGGGALVPLVAATLSAELEVPLLVGDEPALTVACGAAELAVDLAAAHTADDDAADADRQEPDDLDAFDESEAVVHDLDAYRLAARRRVTVRASVVAALLAVLLVTPLSLMDAIEGVSTRSAPGAAVAKEPTTSAPAPAPAPAAAPTAQAPSPAAPRARTTARDDDASVASATRPAPARAAAVTTAAVPAPVPAPAPAPAAPATTAPPAAPAAPTTPPAPPPTTEPTVVPQPDPTPEPTTAPPPEQQTTPTGTEGGGV